MPNADRAAVAREVLTPVLAELAEWPDAYAFVEKYMQRNYPAPPAPETVTVDVYGAPVTFGRSGDAWIITSTGGWLLPHARHLADAKLDRIASDARVIQERDARIAELGRQGAVIVGDCLAAQHAKRTAEAERDAAHARIAELEKEVKRVRELGVTMKNAADRHFATATENYKRAEEARTERDAAWRALEEVKHPVATRETVERVAEALFLSSEQSKFQRETTLVVRHWHDLARAALTAAGFTLEEGV